MPTLFELSLQYRARLLARDRKALDLLRQAWGTAWGRLNKDIQSLASIIEAQRKAGREITKGQVARLARLKELTSQVERELKRLTAYSEELAIQGQREAGLTAISEAKKLAQASLAFPDKTTASIMARWNQIPVAAVESLVGTLADGTPLSKLFDALVSTSSQAFKNTLISGLVSGRGPGAVASEMRKEFGVSLSGAMRITRTEMLRSYRTSTLQSYRANSDIVRGYQWLASLGHRTCIACIDNHGKTFGLEDVPANHVQCKCSIIPVTTTYRDLGLDIDEPERGLKEGDGFRWFEKQPSATQREILGEPMYKAWKAGDVKREQLWKRDHDKTWGDAFRPTNVKEIFGDEGRRYYKNAA